MDDHTLSDFEEWLLILMADGDVTAELVVKVLRRAPKRHWAGIVDFALHLARDEAIDRMAARAD